MGEPVSDDVVTIPMQRHFQEVEFPDGEVWLWNRAAPWWFTWAEPAVWLAVGLGLGYVFFG